MLHSMGKLVRDRIPDIMREQGKVPSVRVIGGEELRKALKNKLVEESLELKEAIDVTSELVDVLEVADAIIEEYGIDREALMELKLKKMESNGAFKKGLYLV
jgi:predicted house-cleaning noncanonical NTP pyrophosphatase (MazG superfamily)